jgi:hypothetical protein
MDTVKLLDIVDYSLTKSISITYDDASRMIDFCKDSDGAVTKDFYDWYLDDKGMFFLTQGKIIIELCPGKENTFDLYFNFIDPDKVEYSVHPHKGKYSIARWIFHRQDNLIMDKVSFDLKYFNERIYKENGRILLPYDVSERIKKVNKEVLWVKSRLKSQSKNMTRFKAIQIVQSRILEDAIKSNIQKLIYYSYALMYYVSKQEIQEIETIPINKEDNTGEFKTVKRIYKYTGYVDLRKNIQYKPAIKKDPNEPTREYNRHIDAWIVRGHYRRTKDGLIWIDEHIKGSGTVENRIYSTVDKSELNLTPKVFEIEKTVKIDPKEISITPKLVIKKTIKKPFKDFIINKFEWIVELFHKLIKQ